MSHKTKAQLQEEVRKLQDKLQQIKPCRGNVHAERLQRRLDKARNGREAQRRKNAILDTLHQALTIEHEKALDEINTLTKQLVELKTKIHGGAGRTSKDRKNLARNT